MKKQRATTFSATPEEASALIKNITGPSPLGSVVNSSENTPFAGSPAAGSLPNEAVKEEAMDEEL